MCLRDSLDVGVWHSWVKGYVHLPLFKVLLSHSPKGLSLCTLPPAVSDCGYSFTSGSFQKKMCYLDTFTYLPQVMHRCSAPRLSPTPVTNFDQPSFVWEAEGCLWTFPRVCILLLYYKSLSHSLLRPSIPSFLLSVLPDSLFRPIHKCGKHRHLKCRWKEMKGTAVFSRSSQVSAHTGCRCWKMEA